jgi:hypothetical protein
LSALGTRFDRDTAAVPIGDGRYRVEMSPGWSNGVGVNGGFLSATLVTAMQAELSDPERALRTFTVHFLAAPRFGAATVSVAVERLGRGLATLSARLEQDGAPLALALAAFSSPFAGAAEYDDTDFPLPTAATSLAPPPEGELSPPFLQNFRIDPCIGPAPFSGCGPAITGGWIELAEPRPLDHALAVALSDSWWPSPFSYVDRRMPAPTIELTVHLRGSLPRASEPVFCEFSSALMRDGLFEEEGRLRLGDGSLLAQSRQLACLLLKRPVS